MPFSVVKAMLDSKTPEEFLNLVLRTVKNNEWKYEAKLTEQDRTRLKEAESRYPNAKKYNGITFQSRELNDKGKPNLIYFEINRTYLRNQDEIKKGADSTKPLRINLFKRLFIPLSEDWSKAAKILGVHREEHFAEEPGTSTISQSLLIPVSAVERWRPFSKLKPFEKRGKGADAASQKIHVLVDDEKFKELNKYNRAYEALFDYSKTLDFLSGYIKKPTYVKTLRLYRNDRRDVKAKPLEIFLMLNARYTRFFKNLASLVENKDLVNATRQETIDLRRNVEREIVKEFGIEECGFSKNIAHQLIKTWSRPKNPKAASVLIKKFEQFKQPVKTAFRR
ncbi:MAG: hypothetical protein V1817_01750 [Candidatus Micrarchaeota archaeon]